MKRFQFRLERVLQLRVDAEDEAARTLATARAQLEDAEREAGAAEVALVQAVAQAAAGTPDATAGLLAAMRLAIDGARERVRRATDGVLQAQQAAEAARQRWQAARADRQALDKLKEQRHESWKDEVSRAEQAIIDDVALRGRGEQGGRA